MIEKLAEAYGKGPVAWFVMLFGGGFTLAAIASGNYFSESIVTFGYGILATLWWQFKRGRYENGKSIPHWLNIAVQVALLSIWVFVLIALSVESRTPRANPFML